MRSKNPVRHSFVLPTKECHFPFGSTRIRSVATAAADLQHPLKAVQGGDQKWGTVLWEKLAEQTFREVFSEEKILNPIFCVFAHLEKQ